MHLFDQYLYPGTDPTAATWMSTLPWWIIDWQHAEDEVTRLYNLWLSQQDPGPGPDRRDIATADVEFPVGQANVLPVGTESGNELSDLVIAEQAVTIPTTTISEAEVAMLSDAEWFALMNPGQVYNPPGSATNLSGGSTVPSGDIFGDLGDVFVDWVGQQVLDQPAQQLSPNVTTVLGTGVTGAPLPGQPITGGTPCATGASPVYKKVCGVYKWVYPKRRRRRALLTNGDYNDLLRIENLKVNKNMSVAIAKALTR